MLSDDRCSRKRTAGESWEELQNNNKVIAIMKHFCAQGAALGGHNAAPKCLLVKESLERFFTRSKGWSHGRCLRLYGRL